MFATNEIVTIATFSAIFVVIACANIKHLDRFKFGNFEF